MSILDQAIGALAAGDSAQLTSLGNAVKGIVPETSQPPEAEPGVTTNESIEALDEGAAVIETDDSDSDMEHESPILATSDTEEKPSDVDSNIVEVAFTDQKGRRTAKVDLTDTDKVKRLLSMAFGAPKLKGKISQQAQEIQELRAREEEKNASYGKLEEAFGEGGVDGIVAVAKLLAGDEDIIDKMLDARQEERARLAAMSDTERRDLAREQERLKEKMEYEKRLASITAKEQEALKREEAARLKVVESRALSAFEPYRMSGKLGDPAQESYWEGHIWEKSLEFLEERGVTEPTFQQLNAAFKRTHSQLTKSLKMSTDKAVDKELETKKAQAGKKAAQIAKSRMQPNADADFSANFRKNPVGALSSLILGRN